MVLPRSGWVTGSWMDGAGWMGNWWMDGADDRGGSRVVRQRSCHLPIATVLEPAEEQEHGDAERRRHDHGGEQLLAVEVGWRTCAAAGRCRPRPARRRSRRRSRRSRTARRRSAGRRTSPAARRGTSACAAGSSRLACCSVNRSCIPRSADCRPNSVFTMIGNSEMITQTMIRDSWSPCRTRTRSAGRSPGSGSPAA